MSRDVRIIWDDELTSYDPGPGHPLRPIRLDLTVDLARRLGVSKQVISRYEETEYQTVAISRLQEILDAIGIKALVTLSA